MSEREEPLASEVGSTPVRAETSPRKLFVLNLQPGSLSGEQLQYPLVHRF